MTAELLEGDCRDQLTQVSPDAFDIAYIDPPFFKQKRFVSQDRSGSRIYSFDDTWDSSEEYRSWFSTVLDIVRSRLQDTGSVFVHCDTTNNYILRQCLDDIFGHRMFRSEIIWTFRRWSNSKKGLLSSHQTILQYSKTKDYKFIQQTTGYSPSTNVDQILEKRARDYRGKSVVQKTINGSDRTVKRGVPLGDVWDMPFLNPKARERTGYPTQKPIHLMRRIMEISTEVGDSVLDPMCGSGSMIVAASIMRRNSLGIDISADAIKLTSERLSAPIESTSGVLKKGRDTYDVQDQFAKRHLACFDYTPVQRNHGIDGIVSQNNGDYVFIRVQRKDESLEDACAALLRAAAKKGQARLLIIQTMPAKAGTEIVGIEIIPSPTVVLSTPSRQDNLFTNEVESAQPTARGRAT